MKKMAVGAAILAVPVVFFAAVFGLTDAAELAGMLWPAYYFYFFVWKK